MSYLALVEIWGPKAGSELELGAQASEAEDAVSACALRGIHSSHPEASVLWAAVSEEEREWNGRMRSGHRVTVAIAVPEPLDQDGERDGNWLRFWIESEVSVALLELINPMTVDKVSVTPAAGDAMERR